MKSSKKNELRERIARAKALQKEFNTDLSKVIEFYEIQLEWLNK